ncbi:MAG: TonB family protein [Pseudomonadota bacterium]
MATAVRTESGLFESFGLAALFVVAGVFGTAAFMQTGAQQDQLSLPALPGMATRPVAGGTDSELGGNGLIGLAEDAFAAGNILSPAGANALHFYQLALEQVPGDEAAWKGLQQTIEYAVSSGEAALFQNRWDDAEAIATQVLTVVPGEESARALRLRAIQERDIEALITAARDHEAAGRIDGPRGFNAVSSYRKVLRRVPDHRAAAAGLASLAQRLLASAQTAALAGEAESAQAFLRRARGIDETLPELELVEASLTNRVVDERNRDLAQLLTSAATALSAERLMPPAEGNAFDLYEEALALDPASEAAQRGQALTISALFNRVRAQIEESKLFEADSTLTFLSRTDADPSRIAELQADLLYAERLAAARRGEFGDLVSLSDLEVIRRTAPEPPKKRIGNLQEGWVEVLFTVGIDGRVLNPEVADSSDTVFERSALSAIRSWRFKPYLVDGRPLPIRSGIRFSFQI